VEISERHDGDLIVLRPMDGSTTTRVRPSKPSCSIYEPRSICHREVPAGRVTASYLFGWYTRMNFPPRCYYCRRPIRWPFGLVVFRGSVQRHVAHRSCLFQKRAYPYLPVRFGAKIPDWWLRDRARQERR
jgi:hypothetical protein